MRAEQFQNKQTPFYCYDLELLSRTIDECLFHAKKYNFEVHYALKANANDRILRVISEKGLGADCVSGNEVLKAVASGFNSNKIVFAGVGKSDKEILDALYANIFCFNVESFQELEIINDLAASVNKKANIAIRINPNVNAHTHHYITTGLEENKFGFNHWELESFIKKMPEYNHLNFLGLHFHIGSQITDLKVFRSLCIKVMEYNQWFKHMGMKVKVLNLGGGLGIDYSNPDGQPIPKFKDYFELFHKFVNKFEGQEIHFEIGRAIVAQCGSLISKVLYIKEGMNTNFAILDAGMTELLRPALYQAYHKIENLSNTDTSKKLKYDVVGPICESSDSFGKAVDLPITKRGDLIAIRSAGAYGEVMSSGYNLRLQNEAMFL